MAPTNEAADVRPRVLITGAGGRVGSFLAAELAADFDVRRQDLKADPEAGLLPGDVSKLEEMTPLMEGVDTVIHLAGAVKPESTWEQVLPANIMGVRNVYEAARQAGVRRVVFASSNHAMGGHDRVGDWPVLPTTLPRPDSLYGVSKVFGETLGRFYHDEFGLSVICLRIGWFADSPLEMDAELLHAMWLSPRDCAQAVRLAIATEIGYGIYYTVSDNPNRRWSIDNTTVELGYRPQDSSASFTGEETVVPGGAPAPENWPKGS